MDPLPELDGSEMAANFICDGVPPRNVCSVEACGRKTKAHGLCNRHYLRKRAYGDATGGPRRLKGEIQAWIESHLDYNSDECLIWPFCRKSDDGRDGGRGRLTVGRKTVFAHRYILELAKGPPPAQERHAAHECGNGHLGCVNPKHLSWKTELENHADKFRHGTTMRGDKSPVAKLTEDEVISIVEKLRLGQSCTDISREYHVSFSTVWSIKRGDNWGWLTGVAPPKPGT